MIGAIPGLDVHWGLVVGVIACVLTYVLMQRTVFGFSAALVGGNARAARLSGVKVAKVLVVTCALGGAAAGIAGAFEVSAVHGRANASLVAGYGYAGILVSFLARHNGLAIIPVSLFLGGIAASGGLLQRVFALPDATVNVLQGILFVVLIASDTLYGRIRYPRSRGSELLTDGTLGLWGIPLAILGGAIRVSTPFIFVSLGECITERSGRVNLGLEGTLVMGAMSGYGFSYLTGSPWLGVLGAGVIGSLLGGLHGFLSGKPRVNDVALGIAMMLLGIGLAFFLGKPLIQPTAPRLGSLPFGFFTTNPQLRSALDVNVLFVLARCSRRS